MKSLQAIKSFIINNPKNVIKGYLFKIAFIIIAVIIVIALIFKSINYASSRYACHVQWQESSIEYKYTLRGGCLLKRGNGWIPAKNYRVN